MKTYLIAAFVIIGLATAAIAAVGSYPLSPIFIDVQIQGVISDNGAVVYAPIAAKFNAGVP